MRQSKALKLALKRRDQTIKKLKQAQKQVRDMSEKLMKLEDKIQYDLMHYSNKFERFTQRPSINFSGMED